MEQLAEYSSVVMSIGRTVLLATLFLASVGIYNIAKGTVVLDERAFPTPESLVDMTKSTYVLWGCVIVALWGLSRNWMFVPYYG